MLFSILFKLWRQNNHVSENVELRGENTPLILNKTAFRTLIHYLLLFS